MYTKPPLASRNQDIFCPIPLPLIGYASVAVRAFHCYVFAGIHIDVNAFQLCYGLEEYRTGKRVRMIFSEAKYRPYYRDMMRSLRYMEKSDSAYFLHTIQKYISDTGRYFSTLLCKYCLTINYLG